MITVVIFLLCLIFAAQAKVYFEDDEVGWGWFFLVMSAVEAACFLDNVM